MATENGCTKPLKPNGCLAVTRSGRPCGNNRESGSDYCYIHSPDRAQQQKIRRQRRKAALIKANQDRQTTHTGGDVTQALPLTSAELQDLLATLEEDKQRFLRRVTELTMTNRLSPAQAREIRQLVKLSLTVPESRPEDPTEHLSDEEYRDLLREKLTQLERKIANPSL